MQNKIADAQSPVKDLLGDAAGKGMQSSFVKELESALSTFNWAEAERLCKRLINELNVSTTQYPEGLAKQILQSLRRKRQFALMVSVGDALIGGGQSAPQILRQYAQAMIDLGNLIASQAVLNSIINDPAAPSEEKAEAKGLLGRIYKQLYVNANDPANPRQQQNLRKAIEYYFGVYQKDPKSSLWHGINVVALLARAQRDRVSVPDLPPLRDIALEISSSLKRIQPLEYWDRATATEAAVALGDFTAAYDHILNYALDQKADAFEIASLLRQLTEVWQLSSGAEPGNMLLPILQTALLKREGGVLRVDPRKVAAEAEIALNANKRLEKVFGADGYEPLRWLRTALERCEAVARVESLSGERIGTGFLVRARDFFPGRSENELLFLTNAHVISPADKLFSGAISPEAACVVFEASGKVYQIEKLIWSSPPGELDATFLTVKSLDGSEFCPLTPPPVAFELEEQPRVYIIGHPLGAGLSISLQDSIWLDTDGRLLHYRTPTQPGSSGSPVFDQRYWTLIGLHHASGTDIKGDGANEGIAITAIQDAITRSSNASQEAHA
jgi:hypothetical protein